MVISERRKLVRCLWSAAIVLTIIVCIAFVYISFTLGESLESRLRSSNVRGTAEKLTAENCKSFCVTEGCLQHTRFLLDRMKPTVDPCDNFFDFACGKLAERFKNESRTFVTVAAEEMQLRVKNLLSNIKEDPDSLPGKVKIVYDTCMKQRLADSQAVSTILHYLARFGIPNWPNLEPDFEFDDPSMLDVMANFIRYNEYGIIGVWIEPTDTLVGFSLTYAPYEERENSTRKYLLEKILQYFNLDSQDISRIWEETERIHDAIKDARRTHFVEEVTEDYGDNEEYLNCTRDEEKEWEYLCETLVSLVESVDVRINVSKSINITRQDANLFFENIIPLLKSLGDRSIANYLAINLFFNHLDELNFYFRLAFQKDPASFIDYLRSNAEIEHSNHCIDWLINNMYIPLTAVYLERVTTMSDMEEFRELIQECIQETANAVFNQDWITDKKSFTEKIFNLENTLILLVPSLRNETLANIIYDAFQPTDTSFLQNVFEHRRVLKNEEMRGNRYLDYLSYQNPLEPKATGGGGEIDIRIGILLPPFHRSGLERLINLATFVMVVTHEIGHNFHESVVHSDDLEMVEYLNKSETCINDQYSRFKFQFNGKNMVGSRYIRENIADSVAGSMLDKLIKKYTSDGDTFSLPGSMYSMKQLFYISAAQVWCEAQTEKEEEYIYNEESHSLGRFRLLGMMQNSDGFAEAFGCPEGSYMNPSDKCKFLQ